LRRWSARVRRVSAPVRDTETMELAMLVVTTPDVPGREITDVSGMVSGEAILDYEWLNISRGGNMLMVSASVTAERLR
jgi:uncharacterized protein YbjQ (UPF0145 family)